MILITYFNQVDILMTPTSPNTAFKFGSKGAQNPVELYLEDLFTISSNLAGLPAISIPHGQVNSLPVGLQLIGNFLREDQLLNAFSCFSTKYRLSSCSAQFGGILNELGNCYRA
jgi:aspartyl-tRNA(Asn)/glutamyl-tRNA(Gln) amidotransferase subunit A